MRSRRFSASSPTSTSMYARRDASEEAIFPAMVSEGEGGSSAGTSSPAGGGSGSGFDDRGLMREMRVPCWVGGVGHSWFVELELELELVRG